jgi:uncharacterized protein DUF6328
LPPLGAGRVRKRGFFQAICQPDDGHSFRLSVGMPDQDNEKILDQRTEKAAREAVEEARMVLPGIQALFGFQLIAVLNERFTELPSSRRLLHPAAIVLVAIAIALIMTPAAYHRQVEPGTVSRFFVGLASLFVAAAMVPLMLALCIEVYILAAIVLDSPFWSVALAALLLCLFTMLWFILPRVPRNRRGPLA